MANVPPGDFGGQGFDLWTAATALLKGNVAPLIFVGAVMVGGYLAQQAWHDLKEGQASLARTVKDNNERTTSVLSDIAGDIKSLFTRLDSEIGHRKERDEELARGLREIRRRQP